MECSSVIGHSGVGAGAIGLPDCRQDTRHCVIQRPRRSCAPTGHPGVVISPSVTPPCDPNRSGRKAAAESHPASAACPVDGRTA
jgi:hypothetical protein